MIPIYIKYLSIFSNVLFFIPSHFTLLQRPKVNKTDYTGAELLFQISGRFSFPGVGGADFESTKVFIFQMQPFPIIALLKKVSNGTMFMPHEACVCSLITASGKKTAA